MADLLERHGFKVHICRDSANCLRQIDLGAGALLLTEEALELERAFDLLEEIRAQPAWSELPLLFSPAAANRA